jgi:bifunctional enzyme CysN/CysC
MLVHPANMPHLDRTFDAMVVWMAEEPMRPGASYLVKQASRTTPATVSTVRYRIDVDELRQRPAETLSLNEIGRCVVDLARPVAFDPYAKNRATGAFILIDRRTNDTVAAGMILAREPSRVSVDAARRAARVRACILGPKSGVAPAERASRLGHGPATLWLTGLTGSGKSTLARALERRVFDEGLLCHVIDGANLRNGLSRDLGFEPDDRAENNRRAAEVARLLNEGGLLAICAFLSPYREERDRAAAVVGRDRFLEIHLSAPPEVCRLRARDDLWERAERGEIDQFPGVSAPYEAPCEPALTLPTHEIGVEECVDRIVALLRERGLIG